MPLCSRAARESYLEEMISTVTAEYLETTSTTSAEENAAAECGTDTKPSLRGAAVISKQTGHELVLENSISFFHIAEDGNQHPCRSTVHGGDNRGQDGRDEVWRTGGEKPCGGVWRGSAEDPRTVLDVEELSEEPPTRGVQLGERTQVSLLDSEYD